MTPISQHMPRGRAAVDVLKERARQENLKTAGRFKWTAADEDCPEHVRLGMLVEEVGEVARAVQGGHDAGDLRTELTQVAAIAVAWLEGLDPNDRPPPPEETA